MRMLSKLIAGAAVLATATALTARTKGWFCSTRTAHAALINYGFLPTPLCGLGF
ncbi:MAG: hypothetical protein ACLPUO_08270 [Streptosporangiaceae bacterium]|jgi:hypothetical protein